MHMRALPDGHDDNRIKNVGLCFLVTFECRPFLCTVNVAAQS